MRHARPRTSIRLKNLACAIGLVAAGWLCAGPAQAQRIPAELLEQFQGIAGDRGPIQNRSELDQQRMRGQQDQSDFADGTFGDIDGEPADLELSPLEEFYKASLATLAPPDSELPEFRQFGYEIFHTDAAGDGVLSGAISDDYVLGVGDSLVFTFRGPESRSVVAEVDREGRIILEDMRPITAVNRTFGDFRADFQAEVAQAFLGAEAYVSLGALRAISVLALGEVEEPGQKQLTSLSTIFDAMQQARGIRKSGSLRNVTLVRGSKRFTLDLYALIQNGEFLGDIGLQDGDRVSVATIGGTFAIAGLINRPGIYELPPGKTELPFNEALNLAGGSILPAGTIFIQLTSDDAGRRFVLESDPATAMVKSGDSIYARPNIDSRLGRVSLMGHVNIPGVRSIFTTPTVASLIPSIEALGETPYTGMAVLRRTGENNFIPTYHPVDMQKVLRRERDYALISGDVLIVLGLDEVNYLNSLDVQNAIAGKPITDPDDAVLGKQAFLEDSFAESGDPRAEAARRKTARDSRLDSARGDVGGRDDELELDEDREFAESQCSGLIELVRIRGTERAGRFANAVRGIHTQRDEIIAPKLRCPEIFEGEFGDMLPYLLESAVEVTGEVRRPGIYPVAEGLDLDALLKIAGGLTREADSSRIVVTRFSQADPDAPASASQVRRILDINSVAAAGIFVEPADRIKIQPKFTNRDSGPVLLAGEFKYPGIYEISRNTHLSEVIARAGGLTTNAYPYGAIFTRESARREEERALKRFKKEIQDALTFGVTRGGERGQAIADAAPFLLQLADEAGEADAIGRIVVEADPTVLQVRSNLDPVLQPGDQLFMPKRPSTISVTGEVLNAGSFQFISGASAKSYIQKAGNFQGTADPEKAFIIFPDGTARSLETSAWRRREIPVPPGSAIVVPRDIAPLDFLTTIIAGTQIVSQLALTAAALNTITEE